MLHRIGQLQVCGRRQWTTGVVAIAAAMCVMLASDATASCLSNGTSSRASLAAPKLELNAGSGQPSSQTSGAGSHDGIVGLWTVSFLVGNSQDVAFQGFQQWQRGGTEVMIDNGVSPAFGNVCVGVWRQEGARTYKLRHTTFNWDENGRPAGTFVLLMTVRLDRAGNAYSGSFSSDSFDLSGNLIPELHVEGRLRASRITVD